MAQVVELLPSKHEALRSNPNTTKKKKMVLGKLDILQKKINLYSSHYIHKIIQDESQITV
jgi:hypothetical protein